MATLETDVDSSTVLVRMMPRWFWERDPRFVDFFGDGVLEQIQLQFSSPRLRLTQTRRPALRSCVYDSAQRLSD